MTPSKANASQDFEDEYLTSVWEPRALAPGSQAEF